MRDQLPQELEWALRERRYCVTATEGYAYHIPELERKVAEYRLMNAHLAERIRELDERIPQLYEKYGIIPEGVDAN